MKGESLCGWELLTTATSPLPTVQGKRRSKVDRKTKRKRNRKIEKEKETAKYRRRKRE